MAPAVKIIDKRPSEPHRHNKVYQTFGRIGISVKKVHDGKGVFFAVANEDSLENILSDESRETFLREGFELVPPIEYNSMKTVVVKNLDYMVESYPDEDIIESVERLNSWATVESVYKIPTKGNNKLVKLRFKNQQMAQVALQKGINILNQHIPHWSIEKELFVRLTPCRNCFKYNHKTKDCKEEKKLRCTYCSEEHKQQDCKATHPRCINCGGPHRTLAAACKVRKDLIKQKSVEVRDTIKSQTQHQQYANYAAAAAATPGTTSATNVSKGAPGLSKAETKEIVTTIMSAIVYSHYVEALQPGSFQTTMTDMYKLNGLKPVNFPAPPMNDIILQSCREAFSDLTSDTNDQPTSAPSDTQTPSSADNNDTTERRNDDLISVPDGPIQVLKRQRESMTPPNKTDKRLKDDSTDTDQTQQMTCDAKPPRPTKSDRETRKDTARHPNKTGARSRSASSSIPSTSMTKNLDITIFSRKNSTLKFTSRDPRDKQKVITAIQQGEVKIAWRNVGVEWEGILKAFTQGKIDFDAVKYDTLDDNKFDNFISSNRIYGQDH